MLIQSSRTNLILRNNDFSLTLMIVLKILWSFVVVLIFLHVMANDMASDNQNVLSVDSILSTFNLNCWYNDSEMSYYTYE